MYKKISMLAVAVILAGAGCGLVSKNVKPAENVKTNQNNQNNVVTSTPVTNNTNTVVTTTPANTTTTTTKIDTTDWKTYSNKEYGFSFRYPNNLTSLEVTERNKNLFDISIKLTGIPKDSTYSFMALKFNSLAGDSLVDWFKKNVDVNKVLKYNLSKTNQGFNILDSYDGNFGDWGDHSNLVIEDFINYRAVDIFGGQDFDILKEYGYYQPELINTIINTIKFSKI